MNTDPRSDAELREARTLLHASLKWLRRIEDRSDDMPDSFFGDYTPVQLRKAVESFLIGDVEDLTITEVRQHLSSLGVDTKELKARVTELIQEANARQRADALVKVIEEGKK